MKQLHKNRWLVIGLILITIFSSLGNSVSVIAETLDSSSVESTITSVEKENSTKIEKTEETSVEETSEKKNETDSDSDELSMTDTAINDNDKNTERSLDFKPPAVGDIGISIVGMDNNHSSAEVRRKYVHEEYIPRYYGEELTGQIIGKLGGEVGDVIKTILNNDCTFHRWWNWPYAAGVNGADSEYGRVRPGNFSVSTDSDSIDAKIEKRPGTGGLYDLTVTRVKKSDATNFKLSLAYDFNYYYYTSFNVFNSWTSWMEMPALNIKRVESQINIPAEPSKNESITANPNKQTINLGSDFSKVSPYDLVKDVKLGNQALNKDDYTVSVQNSVSTDTVGDKTAKVLITYKKDTSKTLTLEVPVQILWGYTIGSNNVYYSTSTGFSLSLLTEDKPDIISTLGNGKNSGNWINDYYPNATYITTKVFKDSQLLNSKGANPYINLALNGRDNAGSAKNKWNGLSNRNQISYGDVLQYDVLSNWGDNKWIMRDEVQKFESLGKQSIYYEITKNGYRTLHLNHLETKNVTIPIYSTEEYLDKNIKDYVDLKGYSNISVKEFSQYPNTKASGQQKGKVIVEETLTTGKKVQYEYEVTFTIGDGTLEYSAPKDLTFKEFSKSKSEQIIQRMYSGDLGLKISDNRGQGKQGNWRLTAQVKQSEELSPYLIFRDGTSQDKYLNQGAIEIYSQAKQSNPTEPLDVEISVKWKKDTGILLKVPPKNNLSSKQYTSTITWNLVEGP